MRETVASNVIIRLTDVATKLNVITKTHKYRRLQKGHHFIQMAMEVHGALGCDMDRFIRECAHLFHDRQSRGHLSLSFFIQFFWQHVSITLQCALASTIKRKIVMASDACSRPPTIIRSHDLHASDIRGAKGEITSYHERSD